MPGGLADGVAFGDDGWTSCIELLEWPELSVAMVSGGVISGSAIPAVGGGRVAVHFYRNLTLARKTTVIKVRMGEVRFWGEVEYFDQVEAKRMGRFIVSFAIDFNGLMTALP